MAVASRADGPCGDVAECYKSPAGAGNNVGMNPPSGQPAPDEDPRLRARADLVWYLRHADALRRWPVLPERWARAVEATRLGHRHSDGPGADRRNPP
jgi:hypothetical protein